MLTHQVSNRLTSLKIQPTLHEQIKEVQKDDLALQKLKEQIEARVSKSFGIVDQGVIKYGERLCVHENFDVKRAILREVHYFGYPIHLSSAKMYKDLRSNYW